MKRLLESTFVLFTVTFCVSCSNPLEQTTYSKIGCEPVKESSEELAPVKRYVLFQGAYDVVGEGDNKKPISSKNSALLEIDTKTGRVWEFGKAVIKGSDGKMKSKGS